MAPGEQEPSGEWAPGLLSPVALLHPDGSPARVVVMGRGCPERLLPAATVPNGLFDLAILAPDRNEMGSPGWFVAAAQAIGSRASGDALVYVLAEPAQRRRILDALQRAGFTQRQAFLHLPNWQTGRYLVPLHARAAQYAFSQVIPISGWKRALSLAALSLPGGKSISGGMLPQAGIALQRPGSRPLLNWLSQLDADLGRAPLVVLDNSWHGPRASVAIHILKPRLSRQAPGAKGLQAVAKVVMNGDSPETGLREIENLSALGAAARQAGVQVPVVLAAGRVGGWPVFVQSALPGKSAAVLLARRTGEISPLVERVLSWLEAWNRATAGQPLQFQDLAEAVLEPARRLAPELEQGAQYCDWLAGQCQKADGRLLRVAAHNDLTVWNLLWDEQAGLAVADWEAARADSLPLVDFFYLLVDGILLASPGLDRKLDREQAFLACFAPGGAFRKAATAWTRRLVAATGLPYDLVHLCMHACMLGHAANEQHKTQPGEPRPFLRIVAWLAANRASLEGWVVG